jgi:hypothetical protein
MGARIFIPSAFFTKLSSRPQKNLPVILREQPYFHLPPLPLLPPFPLPPFATGRGSVSLQRY